MRCPGLLVGVGRVLVGTPWPVVKDERQLERWQAHGAPIATSNVRLGSGIPAEPRDTAAPSTPSTPRVPGVTPSRCRARPDDRDAWTTFLVERCDDMLEEVRRTAADPGRAGRRGRRRRRGAPHLGRAEHGAAQRHHRRAAARPGAPRRRGPGAGGRRRAAGLRPAPTRSALTAASTRRSRRSTRTAWTRRTARMLRMALRDFRRAGVDLDDETRTRLRELAERDTRSPRPSSAPSTPTCARSGAAATSSTGCPGLRGTRTRPARTGWSPSPPTTPTRCRSVSWPPTVTPGMR